MKTSIQWWNKVKYNEKLTIKWLEAQYHGELTAAARIKVIAERFNNETLRVIAKQEQMHATWIGNLLFNRGIEPKDTVHHERYWKKTLTDLTKASLEEISAIGAHAEAMRLERIRVIARDPTAPYDIRNVFSAILPEEEFHEKAFRELAGDEAMAKALARHQQGMNSLGLVA